MGSDASSRWRVKGLNLTVCHPAGITELLGVGEKKNHTSGVRSGVWVNRRVTRKCFSYTLYVYSQYESGSTTRVQVLCVLYAETLTCQVAP